MKQAKTFIMLLALVLAVRLVYFGLFRRQVFSGPSTQFEQAFVAMSLLDGQGVRTFKTPPATVDPSDPTRLIDPERYDVRSAERIPYIKEVPGYGFFLAGLWALFGSRLWLWAQIVQIVFEVLAAWGLYALARRHFGSRAAAGAVLVFAVLAFEARSSVVPYKDIFLLYAMVLIMLFAGRLYEKAGRPGLWFSLICLTTGAAYYFMPSVLLYPLFLTAALLVLKRIPARTAAAFLALAVVIVGAAVWPYQSYVRAHRDEPGVAQPLFWYRFWLGNQVRAFYSTEEERFQGAFEEKIRATGQSLEEICKEEFLADVKARPVRFTLHTVKKLLFGTFLVYANAGDAAYLRSWSYFRMQHPGASFKDYARANPGRILGMLLGTLMASLLFPLGIAALVLLAREKKAALALFFLQVPLYFILLHMFFHYEARYLLGTLAGYLPLAGSVLARLHFSRRTSKLT
jgi:4-amino-4-deoxy-L-arabinose transferase-like glycosyltransferase